MKTYVASRATPERVFMWKRTGWNITSSWINEPEDNTTINFTELWSRTLGEIAASDRLVLFATASDFPLKGALVEVGIALGMGKPVYLCLPRVELDGATFRPVGSWIMHPNVTIISELAAL